MSNDDILKAAMDSGMLVIIPVTVPPSKKELQDIGIKMAKEGPRPVRVIAQEIRDNWSPVWFGAVPYLEAMLEMETADGMYYQDRASDIISYFIGNAAKWSGPTATRVKAELKTMIGRKV